MEETVSLCITHSSQIPLHRSQGKIMRLDSAADKNHDRPLILLQPQYFRWKTELNSLANDLQDTVTEF